MCFPQINPEFLGTCSVSVARFEAECPHVSEGQMRVCAAAAVLHPLDGLEVLRLRTELVQVE